MREVPFLRGRLQPQRGGRGRPHHGRLVERAEVLQPEGRLAPSDSPTRRPRTPRGRARATAEILAGVYPTVEAPLTHDSAFQLLAATILSAQCTDAMVNRVTPGLFAAYPDPASMAAADPADVQRLIQSVGLAPTKSRNLVAMAQDVVARFDGEVPGRLEDLVTLAGVGRKTANVVLGLWFGVPGIAVDTHVLRVARRLGLTESDDPVRVERDLMGLLPRRLWAQTGLRIIFHGRAVCGARRPRCGACPLSGFCPSADLA
ncbi:MAG: endonuclease III [Thermoleophilia bacterium]